ncbi:Transketolase 1 [Piscirickettsia salmonis]|uniref:transketolase n=1 Tax=Piscirickettsia salmonis TaxID=1238 RepID=UPI0012B77CD8|nr:transketolase [Piscirickettsia salmonis]QGP51587.1 Transketolase 1 [Piscirickettsia salmonis]QGP53232.1 Transketolase 1 [Piscirickettsia salmonis]QGP60846.1 Transketolase 1 [Piscirickettsia salmonis]QGP62798.1 Transketolase 1 [Piscirickettsia salmonis]
MLSRSYLAAAIRALSMDAVQQANSGHPGMPMGMADIAEVLWNSFLKHNPQNPTWPNRDRFILSNGHGSMLHYALLHLAGYDLPIENIKNFRQLHSKTAGHPEYGHTPGVETTTGPLGQGIANAVGMALAEKMLAVQFNRSNFSIIDHYTYAFLGDGCLMEGISHEVCSFAGTQKLGKLIAFWDDNGISIDGEVANWFSDDTAARFQAYGWQVIAAVDGHDPAAIEAAINQAQADERPSLICCKTVIGFGSPNKAGSASSHGAALGAEEVQKTRQAIGWEHAAFEIPQDVYAAFDAKAQGAEQEQAWQQLFDEYKQTFPELATDLERRLSGQLPSDWPAIAERLVNETVAEAKTVATRKASLSVLEKISLELPELLGGSADLSGSNCTQIKNAQVIRPDDAGGNYLQYGVREFGMSAIMNGMALYGGFIPFGGTFLTFMDYARNAVRMAALMKQRVIFVYSHDSIGLGEDGPTHQPVEHLASLRSMPNIHTWRPADTVETAVAWATAVASSATPSALVLSRQDLPFLERDSHTVANVARGGYILHDCAQTPQLILIATGSEVQLALNAAKTLDLQGVAVRVVSMPSTEVFDAQDAAYKEQVLPSNVRARLAIEAASPESWYKYVGLDGQVIGMESYGDSAPAEVLFEHFGFTEANVVATATGLLKRVD